MSTQNLTYTGRSVKPSEALNQIMRNTKNLATSSGSDSFAIATYDYVSLSYYGSTNNIHVETFKSGGSGGTTVATLTFTYANGAVANDDLVASITQT